MKEETDLFLFFFSVKYFSAISLNMLGPANQYLIFFLLLVRGLG